MKHKWVAAVQAAHALATWTRLLDLDVEAGTKKKCPSFIYRRTKPRAYMPRSVALRKYTFVDDREGDPGNCLLQAAALARGQGCCECTCTCFELLVHACSF